MLAAAVINTRQPLMAATAGKPAWHPAVYMHTCLLPKQSDGCSALYPSIRQAFTAKLLACVCNMRQDASCSDPKRTSVHCSVRVQRLSVRTNVPAQLLGALQQGCKYGPTDQHSSGQEKHTRKPKPRDAHETCVKRRPSALKSMSNEHC